MVDYLVVGCGFFGAAFTRMALDHGKTVKIVEKRSHIGGNCYTENIEGIQFHTYGPHIFHTSINEVWQFVNRFGQFNHYVNRPKVIYKDQLFSFPINLMTLYQLWGVKTPAEAQKKLDAVKEPIENPKNLEEWILSQVGRDIYEIFIKGYTQKQWKRPPKELPTFIIKRLPIRLTFDDNYYSDPYQGIPIDGYTALIQKMINGADVLLNTDYLAERSQLDKIAENIIFTGRIDAFFEFEFGELEYRTLRFENKVFDIPDYQGNAVINYPDIQVPYTRVTEHKHFEFSTAPKTVVTWEYPDDWAQDKIPYYPINNAENARKLEQYENRIREFPHHVFGGRLAQYKYLDMDKTIFNAMECARSSL